MEHMKHDQVFSRDIAPSGDLAEPLPAVDALAGIVAPHIAPAVDWPRLIAEAGFGPDEVAYLAARELRGVPHAQIAQALGWYSARAERTRKRIERALRRLRMAGVPALPRPREVEAEEDRPLDRGTSLKPFYIEQLDSGRRLYSLSRSNRLLCPELPIVEGPISRGVIMSLEERLKTEAAKLARIAERLHAARVASEAAEREVRVVQVELDTEQRDAVLEERSANILPFEKKLAGLQSTLRAKQAELSGGATAHAHQRELVETLESEIAAQARQKMMARIGPIVKNLDEWLNQGMDLCLQLDTEIQGHYVEGRDIFPEAWHLSLSHYTNVLNSLRALRRFELTYHDRQDGWLPDLREKSLTNERRKQWPVLGLSPHRPIHRPYRLRR
jgi:hypothetical protein